MIETPDNTSVVFIIFNMKMFPCLLKNINKIIKRINVFLQKNCSGLFVES
jgi:hypothetical protein